MGEKWWIWAFGMKNEVETKFGKMTTCTGMSISPQFRQMNHRFGHLEPICHGFCHFKYLFGYLGIWLKNSNYWLSINPKSARNNRATWCLPWFFFAQMPKYPVPNVWLGIVRCRFRITSPMKTPQIFCLKWFQTNFLVNIFRFCQIKVKICDLWSWGLPPHEGSVHARTEIWGKLILGIRNKNQSRN